MRAEVLSRGHSQYSLSGRRDLRPTMQDRYKALTKVQRMSEAFRSARVEVQEM